MEISKVHKQLSKLNNICIKYKVLLLLFIFIFIFFVGQPIEVVYAADGEIEVVLELDSSTNGVITESDINGTDDIKLNLKLGVGNTWVTGLNSDLDLGLKNLLIDNMTAENDPQAWDSYKNAIAIAIDNDNDSILKITLPSDPDPTYEISENEKIKIEISPALIENWEGEVKVEPQSFDIFADPEVFLGGTILNDTSVEDIRRGGKTIEIKLLNATWNKDKIVTISGLDKVLDLFKVDGVNWEIAEKLKLVDPNSYVSIENDDDAMISTLILKLPAFPDATLTEDMEVSLSISELNDLLEDNVFEMNVADFKDDFSSSQDPAFDIVPDISLELNTNTMTETNIKSENLAKIKLTLNGTDVSWNIDSVAEKKALVDAFTTSKQTTQWNLVKSELKDNVDKIDVIDAKTVTITIPAVNDYFLTEDQEITLTVPDQLLSHTAGIPRQTFEIKADVKAIVSGTVTPTVSIEDINSGGKTIDITLVNSTWNDSVSTHTDYREQLINSFTWGDDSDNSIKINQAIIAKGTVKLSANKDKVTITLPPIEDFKLPDNDPVDVNFDPSLLNKEPLSLTNDEIVLKDKKTVFTVTPVTGQDAIISGSITSGVSEFDIANSDNEIVITLKNDTWKADVVNLTKTSNFEISFLKNDTPTELVSIKEVVRNSDKVVTLKLNKATDFNITIDTPIDITIPNQLLTISDTDILKESAFKVLAVKAELSGTGITMDPVDVQKGGKTIIITLKNAKFDLSDVKTFKDGLTTILGTTGDSENPQWNKVVNLIDSDKDITLTNNKITIKLPKAPDYNSDTGVSVQISILAKLIINATKNITTDESIKIGTIAKATLSTGLNETDIKNGNGKIIIALKDATWIDSIVNNKSKQSTLIKKFKTNDQADKLKIVTNAIQESDTGTFTLDSTKKELTITIPKISGYSINRDQDIDVVIPKSLLENYKYDIEVEDPLKIVAPVLDKDNIKSFGEVLMDDFAGYIAENGLGKIRLEVPEKIIEEILINPIKIPGDVEKTITAIEVTVKDNIGNIDVKVNGTSGEKIESNKFAFVLENLSENSDVVFEVRSEDGEDLLESKITKKLPTKLKTYNEVSKKALHGSYSLFNLLTNESKTLIEVFKYYKINDLGIGII